MTQKFFIERSIELLYRNTIDTYRVRVKNPKTVLRELRETIVGYERGKIKQFIAIGSSEKGKYALKDEAVDLLSLQANYLCFNTFSCDFLITLLKKMDEKNYKQVKDCLGIVLVENKGYLDQLIDALERLLTPEVTAELAEQWPILEKIDIILGFLYTELLDKGFSKGFLYRFLYGVFVNITEDRDFSTQFAAFVSRLREDAIPYQIVFRIDSSKKVKDAIQTIDTQSTVCYSLGDIRQHFEHSAEFRNFAKESENRSFIRSEVSALDYLAALKKAKASLAENLDVLNLGFGDEHLKIHSRVLVIDRNNPNGAKFQESKNFLDGKYKVAQEHYQSFIDKLPAIIAKPNINIESKEKVKSAIRYLRLGNESTEVEHKFINYWIGLEYLFSNYESNNTINRIKHYFVICHSLSYVKRNAHDFYKILSALDSDDGVDPFSKLVDPDFFSEIQHRLIDQHPLIAYRARQFANTFHPQNRINTVLKKYVERHQKNLIIHFTRIYRLRNEIIHDAATETNTDSIASNLRYYLTFILNGVIQYLNNTDDEQASIEDYFTINEILLGNISHNNWQLEDLLGVSTPIDFIH